MCKRRGDIRFFRHKATKARRHEVSRSLFVALWLIFSDV
ncbi:Uncharacterized protein dnm_093550 [Desulfonema magnum]|uniref:Uncharacterized protein n=1 Tax=Desulfonema magnum TaxID=45655 RepID=A0A975GTM7_9BACT|nr:Uncharacterized protein dnm_093550 [Desulfonema magnum]